MVRELQFQTILIVDDFPENIDVLREVLRKEYRIKAAVNGATALRIARSEDPPDLVLLDVMMPELDGHEVCRQLKANQRTRGIPVIFVTTRGDVTDEARGFEVGCIDYITKPVSPPLVRARVRTHLALYDQNRVLEGEVSKRTSQLQNAYDQLKTASLDTIVRLSRAAEYKDDDTGAHVLRMSHYAAAVARKLELPEREVEALFHAAPLHDIGKIGIPDQILLKPGKLDVGEWDIMRQHCAMGAKILTDSPSEVIRLGEVVAMTHHEKWDGSGYPRQLAGESIHIAGRITTIADVFDALTSKRPYKDPFSIEKSFSIIREGREKHFDPAVVDAFFEVEQEVLAIKDEYRDESAAYLLSLLDEDRPADTR